MVEVEDSCSFFLMLPAGLFFGTKGTGDMVDCELPSRFELSTLAGPNYHFPFLSIGSCFLVGTEKTLHQLCLYMFINGYEYGCHSINGFISYK